MKQLTILPQQAFLAHSKSTKTTLLVGTRNNHVLDEGFTVMQEFGHLEPWMRPSKDFCSQRWGQLCGYLKSHRIDLLTRAVGLAKLSAESKRHGF